MNNLTIYSQIKKVSKELACATQCTFTIFECFFPQYVYLRYEIMQTICMRWKLTKSQLAHEDKKQKNNERNKNRKKTALDRNRTDRISLTHDLNIDLWLWPSIPCELWSWSTHAQKCKINGPSVPKIECKQTEGRTDGRKNGHRRLHYLPRKKQIDPEESVSVLESVESVDLVFYCH